MNDVQPGLMEAGHFLLMVLSSADSYRIDGMERQLFQEETSPVILKADIPRLGIEKALRD
jgi:hypothetical protein